MLPTEVVTKHMGDRNSARTLMWSSLSSIACLLIQRLCCIAFDAERDQVPLVTAKCLESRAKVAP